MNMHSPRAGFCLQFIASVRRNLSALLIFLLILNTLSPMVVFADELADGDVLVEETMEDTVQNDGGDLSESNDEEESVEEEFFEDNQLEDLEANEVSEVESESSEEDKSQDDVLPLENSEVESESSEDFSSSEDVEVLEEDDDGGLSLEEENDEVLSSGAGTENDDDLELPTDVDGETLLDGKVVGDFIEQVDIQGEIAVKLLETEIPGKLEGDDLSQQEAMSALLKATMGSKDIERKIDAKLTNKNSSTENKVKAMVDDLAEEDFSNKLAEKVVEKEGVLDETEVGVLIDDTFQSKAEELGLSYVASETAIVGPTFQNDVLKVTAKNSEGEIFDIPMDNLNFKAGSVVMVVKPLRKFKPGIYNLEIEITNPVSGFSETFNQDFAWGVLSMNTDKDVYEPGEIGIIDFGVLDDQGFPYCEAKIDLEIVRPDGTIDYLSTTDDSRELRGDGSWLH